LWGINPLNLIKMYQCINAGSCKAGKAVPYERKRMGGDNTVTPWENWNMST